MRCSIQRKQTTERRIKMKNVSRRLVTKFVGAAFAATLLLGTSFSILTSTAAQADSTILSAGDSTSGTYMDYMKTVYARAGNPEIIQLPLTSFDNNFELSPMAAESWTQSADGLTWTFKLRDGLVWSDGKPLTADDYVLSLTRAATSCAPRAAPCGAPCAAPRPSGPRSRAHATRAANPIRIAQGAT